MALEINTENNKDNKTIIELAHQTIPDKLIVGLGKEPYKELAEMVTNNIPINGFVGCVIVNKSVLDKEVPSNFDNYLKVETESEEYDEPIESFDEETGEMTTTYIQKFRQVAVLNENNEPVMIPKTWKEYTTCTEKDTDACILIGYRDNNGNRSSEVTNKELKDYINHFTLVKVRHKNDYLNYIKVQGDEF